MTAGFLPSCSSVSPAHRDLAQTDEESLHLLQLLSGYGEFERRQPAQQDLQDDLELGAGEGLAEAGVGVARKFRITEKGVARLAEQREVFVAGVTDVIADWPAERRRRFIADLRRFNTDIERISGRSWPRPEAEPVEGR